MSTTQEEIQHLVRNIRRTEDRIRAACPWGGWPCCSACALPHLVRRQSNRRARLADLLGRIRDPRAGLARDGMFP